MSENEMMDMDEIELDDEESLEDESDEDSSEEEEELETSSSAPPGVKPVDPPKRKRGRPKGIKAGPRPTVWSCAGLVDGKVIQEKFMAPSGVSDEQKKNFSEEEARAAFKAKYKVEPVNPAQGPFYDQKGGYVAQNPRKKEIISALPTEYEVGKTRTDEAVFHGWRGVVRDVKILNPEIFKSKYGVAAEDCCFFQSIEEVTPNNTDTKRKNKPLQFSLVLASALEPLQISN